MSISTKVSKIETTCGIYDTVYTVRDYGTRIEIKCPYIKWANNNGNLAYATYVVDQKNRMDIIRNMADNNSLIADVDCNIGMICLDDVVSGYGENLNLTEQGDE